jgi:PadR family transcriptional regulator PadR
MGTAVPMDLLHGTLEFLILQTISTGEMHGYTVARRIRDRSGDVILVEEGALYPALHRLERKGLIGSSWGVSENNRKAKFYRITTRGRAALRADLAGWTRYAEAVARVIAPG